MRVVYVNTIHGAQASDLRMPWLVAATSKRKPGTQGVLN
jgi:hypothetical protein